MYENEKPSLPTNIKQIGSISDGLKVYVEDYVYTYIQQYAVFAGTAEKIGLLVGKKEIIDKSEVIFISGIIQGKFSRNENGMEILTEKSWDYINRQIEIYFNNLEIIGWIYIQPGYGDYLNDNLIAFHNNNFRFYYNVLYICDPMEKLNGFFARNEDNGNIEPLKGYFIYYDRNEGMHEYMLQNRLVKPKDEEIGLDENGGYIDLTNPTRKADEEIGEFRRKARASRKRGKIIIEQKKMVNILGSLSAVLFVVCFIMGAGLIKNDDRITNLENQLAAINNSYTYLTNILKEGNVQNVFAAQNSQNSINEQKQQIPENLMNSDGKEMISELLSDYDAREFSEKSSEQNSEDNNSEQQTTEIQTEIQAKNISENNNSADIENNIPKTYVVQKGDSLSTISEKFYGNKNMTDAIMQENNLDNPDMIYFGKVLYLPKP